MGGRESVRWVGSQRARTDEERERRAVRWYRETRVRGEEEERRVGDGDEGEGRHAFIIVKILYLRGEERGGEGRRVERREGG